MKFLILKKRKLCFLLFLSFFALPIFGQMSWDTLAFVVRNAEYHFDNSRMGIASVATISNEKKSNVYFLQSKKINIFEEKIRLSPIASGKFSKDRFKKRINGKEGIIDQDGKEIIPSHFKMLMPTQLENYFQGKRNDSIFLMNLAGEIFSFGNQYASFNVVDEDRIIAQARSEEYGQGDWFLLNFKGKVLFQISSKYGLEYLGKKNYVAIKEGGEFGDGFYQVVDWDGNVLLEMKKWHATVEFDDQILVFSDYTNGDAYDVNLKPLEFSDFQIINIHGLFYKIKKAGKVGYLNKKLEVVVPPVNERTFYHEDLDIFSVTNEHGEIFFDKNINRLTPKGYEEVRLASDRRSFDIKKNGKWGIANSKGVVVVPAEAADVGGMSGTPIYLKMSNSKVFYAVPTPKKPLKIYDENGNLISGKKTKYDALEATDGENLLVKKGDRIGVLSAAGKQKIAPKFQKISLRKDGNPTQFFVVQDTNSKFGMVDGEGKMIVEPTFLKIENLNDEVFILKSEKGIGFFRMKK